MDERRGVLPSRCRPARGSSIEEDDLNGRIFGTLRGRNDERTGHSKRYLRPSKPRGSCSQLARHELKPPFTSHKRVLTPDERALVMGSPSLGIDDAAVHAGLPGTWRLVDGRPAPGVLGRVSAA